MSRFMKALGLVGMSSVYLTQLGFCQPTGGGFSILPNPFGTFSVNNLLTTLGGLI